MPDDPRSRAPKHRAPSSRPEVFFAFAIAALCAAGLAALSWTRPATTAPSVAYQQVGQLSYSAKTAASSPYGTTGVVTGEGVDLRSVPVLSISYSYRLLATAPKTLQGTEQLVAQVREPIGIVRDIPLQAVGHFSGDGFSTTATLTFSSIQAIIALWTRVSTGAAYTVSIVPNVSVKGNIAGEPVKTGFYAARGFTLSSTLFEPSASPGGGTPAITTKPSSVGHPLTQRTSGSVPGPTRPATLFSQVSVRDVRDGSLLLLAGALAGMAFFGRRWFKDATSDDERVRIATRFGLSLLSVDALPALHDLAVVELSSFEGLVRVGQRLECPLLHLETGVGDEYAVVDNGTLYRYTLAERHMRGSVGAIGAAELGPTSHTRSRAIANGSSVLGGSTGPDGPSRVGAHRFGASR